MFSRSITSFLHTSQKTHPFINLYAKKSFLHLTSFPSSLSKTPLKSNVIFNDYGVYTKDGSLHGQYASLWFIPIRTYARRTTKVKTDEEVTTRTGLEQTDKERGSMWGWRRPSPAAEDDDESTESSLTPAIRNHISKVYGTLMAGIGMTVVTTIFGLFVPGLAIIGGIGSLIAIFALIFTDRTRVIRRQNLFLTFCALTGLSLAPLIGASSLGVILAAGLGTAGIFAGFTLAALKAKKKSMLMLGGVLMGGLFLVLFCSLGGLLLPLFGVTNPAVLNALFSINLYLGLGIFSLFVAYDTQQMIESYRAGDPDHITPALNLFLNVLNIFVRLLHIFGRSE